MRIFTSLAIIASIFFTSKTIAQDFETAVGYMSYIGQQQENIVKKYLSYTSAAAHGKKARKVDNLRKKLLEEVQESRMNISGMPSFKGDKSYRDSGVSFLKLYYSVLNEDYDKILNMEDVAEQSYDLMEAYMLAKEMASDKLAEASSRLGEAQAVFAKNNNINLLENDSKLNQKMKEVSSVNKYYNEIYLIFFKPYKQEIFLLDAITRKDITAIEQNRSAMSNYAKEGIEKLKSISAFNGDGSVKMATTAMLNFYIREAEKMNDVTTFLLAQEKFDKYQKEFQKKSSKSKDDVNEYNKQVNEVNKLLNKYNASNSELNKERQATLNDYNKAVDKFFAEHTPRHR